jgi:Protein of unknown function (DUF962)
MRPGLVRWQWEGYPDFHQDRVNLLLHLVSVPAFVASGAGALWAAIGQQWALAGAGLAGMAVAFGAQAVGHKREANPSIPFDGPGDAISRITTEQLLTFWRYLLGGGYWRALRGR